MVQTIGDNYSNFNNPLLDKVITYKNIIPNNTYYFAQEFKNLPTKNYIKCFCPIHGDQADNEKHKCSQRNNDDFCISSLRYNCAHCANENGRSLSHIAFQKHLRKFHPNILEKMKVRDDYLKKKGNNISISPFINTILSNSENSNNNAINKLDKIDIISRYNNVDVKKGKSYIYHHKIKIKPFPIKKNEKNISEPKRNKFNNSSPFVCLQLICACELLIEKTLEIVFHESYLSYDIPMKLMVLKYAITDNKIACEDSIKNKMMNCIESLENYFDTNVRIDSVDLEKELRLFLQFLLNYTNNEKQ